MKKKNAQLISRGLDSELDAEERKKINKLTSEDPEAARVSRIWGTLGDQLRVEDARTKTPDAYVAWQDIRRAIRQSQPPVRERTPIQPRLRWAGALAAVAVIGLLALSSWKLVTGTAPSLVFEDEVPVSRVDWVVTEIPGATTVIFTDEETQMTVIWLDVAQNSDSRDT